VGLGVVCFLGAVFMMNAEFLRFTCPRFNRARYVYFWPYYDTTTCTVGEKSELKLFFQSILFLYMAS
jgi:hypothetical protein